MSPREFGKLHGFTKAQAVYLASCGLIEGATLNPFSKRWNIPEGAQLVDWLRCLPVPAAPSHQVAECGTSRAALPSSAGAMTEGNAGPHPSPSGWDALHAPSASQQAPQGRAVGLTDEDGKTAYSGMVGELKSVTECLLGEASQMQKPQVCGEIGGALAPTSTPLTGFPEIEEGSPAAGSAPVEQEPIRTGIDLADAEPVTVYRRTAVRGCCRALKAASLRQQAAGLLHLSLNDTEFVHLWFALSNTRSKLKTAISRGKAEIGDLRAMDSVWEKLAVVMNQRQRRRPA